jgi:hypothetical protein
VRSGSSAPRKTHPAGATLQRAPSDERASLQACRRRLLMPRRRRLPVGDVSRFRWATVPDDVRARARAAAAGCSHRRDVPTASVPAAPPWLARRDGGWTEESREEWLARFRKLRDRVASGRSVADEAHHLLRWLDHSGIVGGAWFRAAAEIQDDLWRLTDARRRHSKPRADRADHQMRSA